MLDNKQKIHQRNNLKYSKELRKNPTKAESIVRKYLKEKKVKHIFQKGFLIPFHRIVDFYIPKKKIIIEIDGPIHLLTKDKDTNKDKAFKKHRNFKTIRITNEQVYSGEYIKMLTFLQ